MKRGDEVTVNFTGRLVARPKNGYCRVSLRPEGRKYTFWAVVPDTVITPVDSDERAILIAAHQKANRFADQNYEYWQNAENELDKLRAALQTLAGEWERPLTGARQQANTGEDFGKIADEERSHKQHAAQLRALFTRHPSQERDKDKT